VTAGNENKTMSMLHRLPVIVAVTAASSGLTLPASARSSHVNAPQQAPQAQAVPGR
jgi:hypothetical protein